MGVGLLCQYAGASVPAALGPVFLALEAANCSLTRHWTQLVYVVQPGRDYADSRLDCMSVSEVMSYVWKEVDPKAAVGGSASLRSVGNRNVRELRKMYSRSTHPEKAKMVEGEELEAYTRAQQGVTEN